MGDGRGFFAKVRARGLTFSNVCAYCAIRGGALLGGWWGIVRLRLKAWLLGVDVGAGVACTGPVLLARWPGSEIRIGAGASLVSSSSRATASTLFGPVRLRTHGPTASIVLEAGVELSGTSLTARSQKIHIGKQVLFAPNCVVVDSDFHAHWPPEQRQSDPGYERDAPVSIGDYAWIGMGVLILKGVNIGEGAIIAAGSVVTRDVPPRTLAAGSPARVVKTLP